MIFTIFSIVYPNLSFFFYSTQYYKLFTITAFPNASCFYCCHLSASIVSSLPYTWATGLSQPAFIAVTKILLYSAGQLWLISNPALGQVTNPSVIINLGSPCRMVLILVVLVLIFKVSLLLQILGIVGTLETANCMFRLGFG